MTGGGTAQVAFVPETDFRTLPGTPTYHWPGKDIQVTEGPELSNELEDIDVPDKPESDESIGGKVRGSFTVEWAMSTDRTVESVIFNDSATAFTGGAAATSTWYFGLDYLSGTAERAVDGVIPQEYTIAYDDETNTIRETLSCGYASESYNESITPSAIEGPSGGETVPFHGASLDINAVPQVKLSTAELTISDIAQYQWDADRIADDATIAKPSTELSVEAIFSEADQYELALGGTNSPTTPQDQLDAVPASLAFAVAGTNATEFSMSASKPANYSWGQLVDSEDTEESLTLDVNGVEVV